jgi:hypothetical protein
LWPYNDIRVILFNNSVRFPFATHTQNFISFEKKKKKKKKKKDATQALKQQRKGNLPPYYHRERQAPLALLYIE